MKQLEARFVVEVTSDDAIVCRGNKQGEQRINLADLAAVYVETNDSGPWGADVWWQLNDNNGQTKVAFPQGSSGEQAVLARLERLSGFEIKGMNSMVNGRFKCWSSSSR